MKKTVTVWGAREYKELFRNPTKGGEQVMRKGFTLIELLIVIAILGILVALILPRFSDIREDANAKVCVANLRGLVSAMATYETRYNTNVSDWATRGVAGLVTAQYLASPVACPIGGTYMLASGDPDTALCPNVGANPTHKWP